MLSPLPPVEQLRPGLWSIPVPMPNSSLRYVFVYAFESSGGVYIIDVGWNTDDAYGALVGGLGTAGFAITDVKGMLVTHIHPDHYGLAGRVREASGAWVALHPADAKLIQDRYDEPEHLLGRVSSFLRRLGAPEAEVAALTTSAMPVRGYVDVARPDILLEDGDRAEVPGWDLHAIWTPGHSPGHLCFWEGERRLFLSGDHVLPRITPNVPFHPQSESDPLGDFLTSLAKIEHYNAHEVLPAHEHRFVGLGARVANQRQCVARGAALGVVINRDVVHGVFSFKGAAVQPRSYQVFELLTMYTTSSITGTSINTPTTAKMEMNRFFMTDLRVRCSSRAHRARR